MDIAGISAILSSIKTATDIAKLIKSTDVSLEKAEYKLKLAELISALADAKIQVTEIQEEIAKKESEIQTLKEHLHVKQNLKWEHPYYWLEDSEKKDGPFCQNCYDKNKELIRLQGNGSGYWECKACSSNYTDSNYRPFIGAVRTKSRRDWSGY